MTSRSVDSTPQTSDSGPAAAPVLSEHFARRRPSAIRLAQIEFLKRRDGTRAINVAIGNVSLPMHPAMQARMRGLGVEGSPFAGGAVMYTETVGRAETREAFLNVIASSGCPTAGLHAQVTDGGSHAMELAVLGVCGAQDAHRVAGARLKLMARAEEEGRRGAAGSGERPLLILDPTYANYRSFAERTGRRVVAVQRRLREDGTFELPDPAEIERVIREEKPGGLLVIPYDNPTGQLYDRPRMLELAGLCCRYNLWMLSDEAYRELYYTGGEGGEQAASIWSITDRDVPGIEGRRISIESASKVWNACGLRVGALVTDNRQFHERAVAENTANLCANAIGQYIFGALAHESHRDLQAWYGRQRAYYGGLLEEVAGEFRRLLPGVVLSRPAASIYSVVDVRAVVAGGFDAVAFVQYCAREGRVVLDGEPLTLLAAPMGGFYSPPAGTPNPGATQMRIAYVEPRADMVQVPRLFRELLEQYEAGRRPPERNAVRQPAEPSSASRDARRPGTAR